MEEESWEAKGNKLICGACAASVRKPSMGTGQTGQQAPDSSGLLASPEPQDQDYNHTMALFCALHALKNLTGKTELNMFRQETSSRQQAFYSSFFGSMNRVCQKFLGPMILNSKMFLINLENVHRKPNVSLLLGTGDAKRKKNPSLLWKVSQYNWRHSCATYQAWRGKCSHRGSKGCYHPTFKT